ncbi:hypothetical protein [Clostridium sp.]|uniref:hypothetical protein n=1 Tax=Clostridium sp. TaxID=1506 RepID=UPI0025B87FDD|nr:hypothetical protein [Clostridium sp.]
MNSKLYSFRNEKVMAESFIELLANGEKKEIRNFLYKDNNITEVLKCYIKWMKENKKGNSKENIKQELETILREYYPKYVMVEWDNKLTKMVNKYTKPHIRNYYIPPVMEITKIEFNFINEFKLDGFRDLEVRKILYTLLVLAKSTYTGKELWVNNYDVPIIFNLARYKYNYKKKKVDERAELLFKLKENGLIDISKFDGNIKIKYGQLKEVIDIGDGLYEKLSYNKEDILFEVPSDNADNIILTYLNWIKEDLNKGGYCFCKECGKEIKQKAKKPTTMCKTCADNKRQQQKNEWKKKNGEL